MTTPCGPCCELSTLNEILIRLIAIAVAGIYAACLVMFRALVELRKSLDEIKTRMEQE